MSASMPLAIAAPAATAVIPAPTQNQVGESPRPITRCPDAAFDGVVSEAIVGGLEASNVDDDDSADDADADDADDEGDDDDDEDEDEAGRFPSGKALSSANALRAISCSSSTVVVAPESGALAAGSAEFVGGVGAGGAPAGVGAPAVEAPAGVGAPAGVEAPGDVAGAATLSG